MDDASNERSGGGSPRPGPESRDPGAAPSPDESHGSDRPAADAPERERPYRSVLKLKNFRRLWIGLTISSLGDWIGLFALLSVTNRLAPENTLAVGGLMIFRMLPAFLVGPLAGVALDRMDRRKAMIVSDVIRAGLIGSVPFAETLPALYAISFALETISLIWMPAKDALVPNLVPGKRLVTANSLALFTTYGVFPLGALVFTGLVGVGEFLGTHVSVLSGLALSQENLALWIDTATFLVSALVISRMRVPRLPREKRPIRLRVLWDEVVEGLRYVRARGEVAQVMQLIGVALAGGAVVFSLGAPYATQVLGGGPTSFGGIVAALGTGMGLGVLVLGFSGDRLPKGWIAAVGVIVSGMMLVGAALVDSIVMAVVVSGLFGAGAGVAYATGFALLQEKVADSVRGRTFASVQIVIRVSLFASLIAFPALAEVFATTVFGGDTGDGIRLAIATGGLITCASGAYAAWAVYQGRIDP